MSTFSIHLLASFISLRSYFQSSFKVPSLNCELKTVLECDLITRLAIFHYYATLSHSHSHIQYLAPRNNKYFFIIYLCHTYVVFTNAEFRNDEVFFQLEKYFCPTKKNEKSGNSQNSLLVLILLISYTNFKIYVSCSSVLLSIILLSSWFRNFSGIITFSYTSRKRETELSFCLFRNVTNSFQLAGFSLPPLSLSLCVFVCKSG